MIVVAPDPVGPLGQTATALLRKLGRLRIPLKPNFNGYSYIISQVYYDNQGHQHNTLLYWAPGWARDRLVDRGYLTEGGSLTKEGREAALD